MAVYRPPLPKFLDLDITIVSAKHLKNVNWKNGDLKPYAVFWVDPDRQLVTKSDDSGSSRSVWNERFTLPLALPLHDSVLILEIFHSKPSEVSKPLVATLRVPLKDLPYADDPNRIRTFQLTRPSGRPQGKIRVKLAVKERPLPPPPQPDYHFAPPPSYYYQTAPLHNRGYSQSPYVTSPSPPYSAYPDAHTSQYFSGYYHSAAPPLPPPRPFFDRTASGYGSGPSAPVDYLPYDHQRQKGGKKD